ncbi:MAG TPA: Rossmann-like and DUF2520 domain-containing protein [Burkholderiales bacterium]|nr:Rossmann-like and DUF2520 domain-containing protein [Burkholderiales bacterium]
MRALNIIGSGRVGRACGRLWARARVFEIQDVLTRSRESAAEAVKFIGAGRAVGQLAEMRPADVWMIATRDDAIVPACATLAASGKLVPDDIVFHVSGATPSGDLAPAKECGTLIASVHPIKTFTDPEQAARTFAGTYCAAEGDREALRVLRPAFERIGATVFEIRPELKAVYHAGGVFACNYLVALIEAALRAHGKAGIPSAASLRAIEPMVRETVDAVFARGPARALTGPVSRGDVATVRRQLAQVAEWDSGMAALYRGLGLIAVDLAEADGRLDAAGAAALREALGPAARENPQR